jgi:hypothetical protein
MWGRKFTQGRNTVLIALFLLLFQNTFKATTCTSLQSGDWHNGTWSCGVPGCGDTIIVQAGHTVTISAQADYSACTATMCIIVYGKLKFVTGNKLRLPCGSQVHVMPGGSIEPGNGGGGNSNYIEICNMVTWNAAAGPLYGPACLGCGVLPITLANFSASPIGQMVELKWNTKTEQNNDYFEIERSEDGAHFFNLFKEYSKNPDGNSNTSIYYSLLDENPIAEIEYYRLRQVDKDQSANYSPLVAVKIDRSKNPKALLYPNPNNGEFIADASEIKNAGEIKVRICNTGGSLVHESAFYYDGQNPVTKIVPEKELCAGFYFCIITIQGIDHYTKMLVTE